MQVVSKGGGVIYLHVGVVQSHRTSALAFPPPLVMCVYTDDNPLPASSAYPPEVPLTF